MAQQAAHHSEQADPQRLRVTVDVILFAFREDDLKVLLIARKYPPFTGHWAIPGGFVEIHESLEEAARRELDEETGIRGVYLEQLYTFGEPERDPRGRVVTVAYFALVPADQSYMAGSDAAGARWCSMYDLPQLAFDHDRILNYALQRLRWKLEYTALGFLLLPREFTLTELQLVYERILREKLDKRNFRRKILNADILEETGELRVGDPHRPARLYRFTAAAIELEQARRRFP